MEIIPSSNLININEEQFLWRMFDFKYALDLIQNQTNALVKPWKWDDPFENILSKCSIPMSNGFKVNLSSVTDNFYAQCWTDQEHETDAMWRIYLPDKKRGVRIKVQAGKLFRTIYSKFNNFSDISCFLGKVQYVTEEELEGWLHNLSFSDALLDSSNFAIAKSLLIKRMAFAHESEVRLLFDDLDNLNQDSSEIKSFNCNSITLFKHILSKVRLLFGDLANTHQEPAGIKRFNCDPNNLIEHILLDPRWTEAEAEDKTKELTMAGYQGKIEHSKLYRIPRFENLTF